MVVCRYFDIVPFARMEFYQLMCSDACSLCLRTIHKPVSPTASVHVYTFTCSYVHVHVCVCPLQETRTRLNLEMLGLLYRLNERDNEWENVIPPELVYLLSLPCTASSLISLPV